MGKRKKSCQRPWLHVVQFVAAAFKTPSFHSFHLRRRHSFPNLIEVNVLLARLNAGGLRRRHLCPTKPSRPLHRRRKGSQSRRRIKLFLPVVSRRLLLARFSPKPSRGNRAACRRRARRQNQILGRTQAN